MKAAVLALFMAWCCMLQPALAKPKKRYPVSKVVTLLRDMQKELEKEAENDEEVFEKLDCWCKTNDREKSMSLQEAEQRSKDMLQSIQALDSAIVVLAKHHK